MSTTRQSYQHQKTPEAWRNQPGVGVGVVVVKDGKILLGKRKNSHGDSQWGPPGGHLEFGETVEECAKRELFEETNLIATKLTLNTWTEDFFYSDEGELLKHYLSVFVTVDEFEGELELKEPHKCYGWHWVDVNELPKNLFDSLATFLKKTNFGSYANE